MEKPKKYWLISGSLFALYVICLSLWVNFMTGAGMEWLIVLILNPWIFLVGGFLLILGESLQISLPTNLEDNLLLQIFVFALINFGMGAFLGFLYTYFNKPRYFWYIIIILMGAPLIHVLNTGL